MACTGRAAELRPRWTHRRAGLLRPGRAVEKDPRPQPPGGVMLAWGVHPVLLCMSLLHGAQRTLSAGSDMTLCHS